MALAGLLSSVVPQLTGSALGLVTGNYAARQQRQFNSQQAQISRNWQERMSSTAYQRKVADLKKAGLNPILAVGSGGSSTPSGATASTNDAGVIASSAKEFARLGAEISLLKAQAKKTNTEERLVQNKINQSGLDSAIKEDALNVYDSWGKKIMEAIQSGHKKAVNFTSDTLMNLENSSKSLKKTLKEKPQYSGPKLEDGLPRYKKRYDGTWYDRLKKKVVEIAQ